jgi:hypothetical protein
VATEQIQETMQNQNQPIRKNGKITKIVLYHCIGSTASPLHEG